MPPVDFLAILCPHSVLVTINWHWISSWHLNLIEVFLVLFCHDGVNEMTLNVFLVLKAFRPQFCTFLPPGYLRGSQEQLNILFAFESSRGRLGTLQLRGCLSDNELLLNFFWEIGSH